MNFPVKLDIRLDWSEMDLFGHINNVMYFKYVQASRVNYWEAIGLNEMISKEKQGPILASTNCQFLKQLHFPGNIQLRCLMEFIKNTSFGFHHQILTETQEIAAEAYDVMVMFDFSRNEKIAFPDALREKVRLLEGSEF
jgi:acyl-CoA thioester hydrolase